MFLSTPVIPANMSKKPEKIEEEAQSKEKKPVKATLIKERVLTESSDESRLLYDQSRYGSLLEDGKLQLSLLECLYLMEKKRVKSVDGRGKEINFEKFMRRAQKLEPNFWIRYCVFKDIRNRGYIIKTALKFLSVLALKFA